jgi:DNA-binding MarR family transcriptional regulator
MGKHAQKARSREVAGVFVPISPRGLSMPLMGPEWRKDLLMSWLFQTCIRLQRSLDSRFLKFGMTVQEASVLLRCVEAGRITPGQLAVQIGRDKGMITRFINRLEQGRLLARDINPRDRRIADLKPTAKGKRVARDLAFVFCMVRKELFVGMLESDVCRVSKLLTLLYKNAVGIGSRQKCTALRQRWRIGRHRTKEEVPQTSQTHSSRTF